MKKVLLLLLALTFIVGSFASCKKDPADTTESNTTDTSTPVEEGDGLTDIEKRALEKDFLPDDLDFEQAEFKTYSFYEMYDLDVNGTDGSGDAVLDSVFERNRAVERRLNIYIENVMSSTGKFEDFGTELDQLGNSSMKSYDAIFTMGNSAIQMGITDVFMDIDGLEYISKDANWWWADAMQELAFDVKHQKFLMGDICLSGYTRVGAMLVNMTDYERSFQSEGGINGLYELVENGGWTIAELQERASSAYSDPNGNGLKMEDTADQIGLAVCNIEMIKFLEYSFDVQRYSRDADGCAVLDYDIDRASTAVDALIGLLFETDGVYWQESYHKSSDFPQGRTLFQTTWVSDLLNAEMREMDDLYTLVPMPKLDNNQKEYRANIQNSAQVAGVLKTVTETDYVSAVLEALCTESYRKVVLPFYEVALKVRYAKDSGVGKMIDIINGAATKNFLYEYQPGSGCGALITNVVMTESNKLAGEYASAAEKTEQYLAKLKAELYPTT